MINNGMLTLSEEETEYCHQLVIDYYANKYVKDNKLDDRDSDSAEYLDKKMDEIADSIFNFVTQVMFPTTGRH